jgi:serine phosphatase RsbU (regulator of sigma subunit)
MRDSDGSPAREQPHGRERAIATTIARLAARGDVVRELLARSRSFGRRQALAVRLAGIRALLILVITSAVEIAAMVAFGLTTSHHDVLGVTGAVAVLVAVGAAIAAGPSVGVLVAVAGGIAFFVFISDPGATVPLIATLAATALWSLAALASGVVAARLRQQEVRRRQAEAEAAALHARFEADLLPSVPRHMSCFELSTRSVPGEQRLGIGGDFFDAAAMEDGRLALIIGDVAGHGPDAAALGSVLRASWHALISSSSPERLVTALGEVLAREKANEDLYATVCLAWLPQEGTCVDLLLLGHPSPLLVANSRAEPMIVKPSLPLGLADEIPASPQRIRLPESWSLLFYTDGLIEGLSEPGGRSRYGLDRLAAAVGREAHALVGGPGLDRVVADVVAANGGPLRDDVTVLQVSAGCSAHGI